MLRGSFYEKLLFKQNKINPSYTSHNLVSPLLNMNADRLTVKASPQVICGFARDLFLRNGCPSQKTCNIRFRALFGVTPKVCNRAWYLMRRDARLFLLFWALLFLKTHGLEHVNSVICGVDAKNFRKWSWKFVRYLANIDIVRCKNLLT